VTSGSVDVPGTTPTASLDRRYLNRELSWLDFNARVLSLAEEPDRPLLERVKFVAIVAANLDEFFQIRVAGLKEQVLLGVGGTSMDGLTAAEQLREIRERVEAQVARQERLFVRELAPALERNGIRFCQAEDLTVGEREYLDAVFHDRIFPVLTPLAVDPAHPFPYISNLSLNLAVLVRDRGSGVRRFARVKVPPLLPRFEPLPGAERFLPLEQLIALNLSELFPGMDIVGHHPFRVTRNADLEVEEDEAADLLAAIEEEIRRRRRFAQVVRLEVERSTSAEVRELLTRELELQADDVYETGGLLDLTGLWALYPLDRPDLKESPWKPATQPRLARTENRRPDLFAVLREGDVLVHHPYDSFATSVEAFIARAAEEPSVLAIKQTLYRTSGQESPIVRALIRAAEAGKQVVALVELRARFDEQANIAWARALEEAGVHVVYGVVGLKTHAKISLVVRQEDEGIRRYAHIGTGNYNPTTATIYEDMGLLTADPELGADLTDLFNYLTGYSRKERYQQLLVAPLTLRDRIVDLIHREAGRPEGRIVIKVNNLVDAEVIDALYEASNAGTRIDLVVRSICGLRPGVSGLSDNIRVRSIVGRYLEHARILRFGPDDAERTYLIGSADLMPRNLDWRVEALTPVTDPRLQARIDEVLEVNLSDDVLAWSLAADGTWRPAEGGGTDAQARLQDLAVRRMRGEEAGGRA
jgi:polyphosphate kinase